MTYLRLVLVCVGVLHTGSCSSGLKRNLQCGAGIGFGVDGLEMVGFMCGTGFVAADGLRMFDFIGESGCSAADGLEMVEIVSSDVDGLEMGVCNGCMCWQVW